jgi:hypothetical protein
VENFVENRLSRPEIPCVMRVRLGCSFFEQALSLYMNQSLSVDIGVWRPDGVTWRQKA